MEWLCSTYGYSVSYVLDELPAAHAALLYRASVHTTGACKSGTFQEDDLAAKMAKEMEEKCSAVLN